MQHNEYIHRMLVYWDPWGLINNCGAPEDEYDSYIPKITEVLDLTYKEEILSKLKDIFSEKGMPTKNLERAIEGMAEGVMFLKK